jgi:two-component system response regulator GlrR
MTDPDGKNGQNGLDGADRGDRVGRRREDRIVGPSEATQRAVEQARAAARDDLPVWLWGPTGAGKEFFARAIHSWSSRRDQPFDVVACASIPPALQARELFGCAAGTHPSVPEAYVGRLARAAGGSILLDGAPALLPEVRSTLLRALAERRFRPEGAGEEQALRARLLSSADARSDGAWLGELPRHELRLVPLAERTEDVAPLAAHFLAVYAEEAGVKPVGFTPEARAWLLAERWPGNVRELRERIRQAVRIAGTGAVSAEALLLSSESAEIPSFKEAKRAFETRYVCGLLRRCNGNISRAARLAKKDRKDFYDVIRRTGVDPAQFRS